MEYTLWCPGPPSTCRQHSWCRSLLACRSMCLHHSPRKLRSRSPSMVPHRTTGMWWPLCRTRLLRRMHRMPQPASPSMSLPHSPRMLPWRLPSSARLCKPCILCLPPRLPNRASLPSPPTPQCTRRIWPPVPRCTSLPGKPHTPPSTMQRSCQQRSSCIECHPHLPPCPSPSLPNMIRSRLRWSIPPSPQTRQPHIRCMPTMRSSPSLPRNDRQHSRCTPASMQSSTCPRHTRCRWCRPWPRARLSLSPVHIPHKPLWSLLRTALQRMVCMWYHLCR
jgi:hypothetical protein